MKTKILEIIARGKQIIIRHRRTIMIVAILAAVAFLVVPHLALAAPPESAPSSLELDKMYREITRFITFIMEFLQRLIWPVLLLIGGLMKNDILFGAGMEDRMLAIWVQIRNLVNILFVLVLLGIAFYNVVGGSNQAYQLKGILPKFVIGLIAVNFSFIGVKLLVDTVNVTTTAIFALPDSVQAGLGKDPLAQKSSQETICKALYGEGSDLTNNIAEAKKTGNNLCDDGPVFTQKAKQFFANFDANNAGVVMALNLSKISDWGKVNPGVKDAKGLALNTIFSATLFIVFATAFVALFVVLLIRLIVLWVTLVLSPLIVLTYVLPENLSSSVGGGDLKKKFVKNAIAPLPIALMMTIGFMMLQGMRDSKFTQLSNMALDTSSISMGLFTTGLSTLQELVIAVGTVAVIWMGVFEAAKGTYADSMVEKIGGAVKGVGKFAASSFKYAPIFPVKTGAEKEGEKPKPISLAAGLGLMEQYPQMREQRAREEGADLLKRMTGKDIMEATREVKKATSGKDAMRPLVNVGALSASQDKDALRAFGEKVKKYRTEFSFDVVGEDGKPIKPDTFINSLIDGKADPKTVQRFIELNQTRMDLSPQAKEKTEEEKKKKDKETGELPKGDHDRAKREIDASKANVDMLNKPKQKEAVAAYQKAMSGNKKAEADKQLQAMKDTGALDDLENLNKERDAFIQSAATAPNAGALDNLIAARRKAIEGRGITDKKQVDRILRTELDSTINTNPAATTGSTIVTEEFKKIAPVAATTTATTALQEAPAKPAGNTKAPAPKKEPSYVGLESISPPPAATPPANPPAK